MGDRVTRFGWVDYHCIGEDRGGYFYYGEVGFNGNICYYPDPSFSLHEGGWYIWFDDLTLEWSDEDRNLELVSLPRNWALGI
jgi:hypothetical protein